MLHIIITLLQILMMLRAVMSWLPIDEDSNVGNFIYAMTEPVVMPIRAILSHFEALDGLPIDMSFLTAYVLLSLVRMMLPVI